MLKLPSDLARVNDSNTESFALSKVMLAIGKGLLFTVSDTDPFTIYDWAYEEKLTHKMSVRV
jgi:hypothetical protein